MIVSLGVLCESVLAWDPPPPPCEEKGPYYGAWYLGECPPLINSPSMSPNKLCGNVGEAPCKPSVTPPAFGNGIKYRDVSYDCDDPKTETNTITYSVSEVMWDPPIPEKWQDEGTFESTAYVEVTGGDDLCPAPGRYEIGKVLWTIVDPESDDPTFTLDVQQVVDAFYSGIGAVINAVLDVTPGCEITGPEPYGEITYSMPSKCCACDRNEILSFKKAKGEVGVELKKFECAVPGLGYQYKDWFWIGIIGYASGKVSVHATYIDEPCDNGPVVVCTGGSVTATLGFKAGGTVNIRACSVSVYGAAEATGGVSGEACSPGSTSVTFKLESLKLKGHAYVKTVFFQCEKELWEIELSPPIVKTIEIFPPSA